MDSKVCLKCKEEKDISRFTKNKSKKDGHNNWCKSCMSDYRKTWNQTESAKAKSRASSIKHHREKRDTLVPAMRVYHANNRDNVLGRQKRWRGENLARERQRAILCHKERAKRKVSWANEQLISAYYTEALRLEELTGIKFHVDHIIPLQGELVSGLHVENNLQLLSAHENISKSNSFDLEVFNA